MQPCDQNGSKKLENYLKHPSVRKVITKYK